MMGYIKGNLCIISVQVCSKCMYGTHYCGLVNQQDGEERDGYNTNDG